jgi:N-acetylmuramoyl-L-alanine amidase
MFIVKRSLIITFTALFIAAIIIGICAGTAYSASVETNSLYPTIVIDAGHGGIDAGVLGINTSTKESNINLAISKYLRGYFVDAGFNVVATRTSQNGLYGTTAKGFKMRDMQKRKSIIEGANADMVISIHQNFCPLKSKRGGIVFYDNESSSSLNLAQSIQQQLNALCDIDNSSLYGDYYMLKCTSAPSVIVECGFLSNEQDESLLIDAAFQKNIAYAIFKGAVAYFA